MSARRSQFGLLPIMLYTIANPGLVIEILFMLLDTAFYVFPEFAVPPVPYPMRMIMGCSCAFLALGAGLDPQPPTGSDGCRFSVKRGLGFRLNPVKEKSAVLGISTY